jgi:hypothetical protein
MKRRRLAVLPLLALGLAACATARFRKVSIEIPAVSPVAIEGFKEIAVLDFSEAKPAPDLRLGEKIADAFEAELKRAFKGKVSRRRVPGIVGPEAGRESWKAAGAGLKDALVLGGSIAFVAEAQKALRPADLPADGPFKLDSRGLAERTRFVWTVECLLVDPATGDPVFKKRFTETRSYPDLQQSPEFAFFDLVPVVNAELLSALFGRQSIEERYLLVR